jgi:TatD DNase family protein
VSFVDTHCHLNFDSYQNDLEEVVDRALEAGVTQLIIPGLDIRTSIEAVEIASRFENIYAAVGVHPNESLTFERKQNSQLKSLLAEPKVIAVGEIGLDFYHNPENKLKQIEVLEMMLDNASNMNKPVILHSRNSLDDLITIIQRWIPGLNKQYLKSDLLLGVFHAFEGSLEQAFKVRELSMAIGVGGPITYKNAKEKQEVIQKLGIDNLVLETDSPFLSPHPFRGQRNEPARIPLIAQKIADLLEKPLTLIEEVTTKNAKSLFHWDAII